MIARKLFNGVLSITKITEVKRWLEIICTYTWNLKEMVFA
jgi:hypothetical protein